MDADETAAMTLLRLLAEGAPASELGGRSADPERARPASWRCGCARPSTPAVGARPS